MSCHEKVVAVIWDDSTWYGVPTSMASVLELFKWEKFSRIQAFISSKQVVSVASGGDDDDDDDDDDEEDDRAAEGVGSVLR